MSQSSFSISNISRTLFRTAVNTALQALASNNSGASEPTETYAHMWWPDTTSGWVKQRNAANSAWEKKFPIAKARVDVASAATLDLDANAVTSDYLRITGTTTVTAVTLAAGQRRIAVAGGAFQLTNSASLIVQGGANYTTAANDLLLFFGEAAGVVRVFISKADGTALVQSANLPSQAGNAGNFLTTNGTSASWASPSTASTAQTATSGSAKTFGSIPASHNCIDVIFDSLSLNGSDDFLIQIGDAGGIETSGYTSSAEYGGTAVSSSSGFVIRSAGNGNGHSGIVPLRRISGNTWVCGGVIRLDVAGGTGGTFSGRKELSDVLTQVSVTRTGSNSFDNGTVNVISY